MNGMFAFIADSHVNTRGMRPEIPMEDTLLPLQAVARFCIDNRCPLIMGGDLYDVNTPQSHLVYEVNGILTEILQHGNQVYTIQGNHDKTPKHPWASHARGVQHVHGKLFTIGSLRLYGLDFAPASVLAPQLQQIPECDVLILHQALHQGLKFQDAWNCDLDWIDPLRVRDVLIGDLHRVFEELWSTDGKVRALYSGSQYMTAITETHDPSFLVVTGKTGDHLMYRREPLPHRRFIDVTLTTPGDLQVLLQGLDTNGKPVINVHFPQGDRGIISELKKAVGDRVFLIETPEAASTDVSTSRHLRYSAKEGVTLAGVAMERLKDSKDPYLPAFVRDLVGCRTMEALREVVAIHRDKVLGKAQ